MATKKLTLDMFPDAETAFSTADQLLSAQKATLPELENTHPPKIFPGFPLLDMFYYIEDGGMLGVMRKHAS